MKNENYIDVTCQICKRTYKMKQSKQNQEPYHYDLSEEDFFSEFMFKLELVTLDNDRFCSSCLENLNNLTSSGSKKKTIKHNRHAKNREVDY